MEKLDLDQLTLLQLFDKSDQGLLGTGGEKVKNIKINLPLGDRFFLGAKDHRLQLKAGRNGIVVQRLDDLGLGVAFRNNGSELGDFSGREERIPSLVEGNNFFSQLVLVALALPELGVGFQRRRRQRPDTQKSKNQNR